MAQTPNVEALARLLAWEDLSEYLYSDYYYGGIDEEDPKVMRKEMERGLPRARERAQEYLKAAGVL